MRDKIRTRSPKEFIKFSRSIYEILCGEKHIEEQIKKTCVSVCYNVETDQARRKKTGVYIEGEKIVDRENDPVETEES